MKPRAEIKPAPKNAFAVTIGDDDYHFAPPSYGAVTRLLEWAGQTGRYREDEERANLSEQFGLFAACIGLYWANEGLLLEAKPPTAAEHRANGEDAWDEFSEAVQVELAEEGVGPRELMELGLPCLKHANEWISDFTGAKERADFSQPKEAQTSGS